VDERETWTIDELARHTGLTARNIRAYQSRGLVDRPEIRGRTGHYGPRHVARLQLIRELQAAGFSLDAIRRLLELAPGATVDDALRFGTALLVPWAPEEPEIVEATDLARRFGVPFDPNLDLVRRAAALGILEVLEDGRVKVNSPTLLRAGEQVVALGVPVERALDVVEEVTRDAEGVARAFVELFEDHVWDPFEAAGRPDEDWVRIRESAERLNPIATQVLLAAFRQRMSQAVQ
jgi:DNA-binding transcriptional MerR regulator